MKKLGLPLLAAFGLLMAAGLLGASPNATERYVSVPLADGSRYTFVYPQSMKVEHSDGNGCLLRDRNATDRLSTVERLKLKLSGKYAARQSMGNLFLDEITVQVATQKLPYLDSRSNHVESRRQFLSVEDARSRTYFFISHQGYGSQPDQFKAESATLNESFRVLAPGEAVPQ